MKDTIIDRILKLSGMGVGSL